MIEQALHRVVIESPVHGPVVVARVKELEAERASREHTLGVHGCWCNPTVEAINCVPVVKHR